MGQGLSCVASSYDHDFFTAVQGGDLAAVVDAVTSDPMLMQRTTVYDRLSALHIAAANGRVEVLSMLLERSVDPDVLNRCKQTPLMLAAMHGKIACVGKLLESRANILMFDVVSGRTCLHYAAYYGHSNCLQAILSAAQSTSVSNSWGFARFVNVRDGSGATPLHLASRQKRSSCVRILLDNGALVSAVTGGYGFPGSTPLHLAAYGGNLDCVRQLLARGADRLVKDSAGRIPYIVALKRQNGQCAALLDPSAVQPLVWPSSLKFISELDQQTKSLLEAALAEANAERESKILKQSSYSSSVSAHSDDRTDDNTCEDSDAELCCICFDQVCTIEVHDCGHQMCANCILSLCCQQKPDPVTHCSLSPSCPFCRSKIIRLVALNNKTEDEGDCSTMKSTRSRRSSHSKEESCSFQSLSSAMGSFGKMGLGSASIADTIDMVEKF